MSDNYTTYNFESVFEAILMIEERFSEIHQAEDFVLSSYGVVILDGNCYEIASNWGISQKNRKIRSGYS